MAKEQATTAGVTVGLLDEQNAVTYITVEKRLYQLTLNDNTEFWHHVSEDADGRWLYRRAR